MKKATMLGALSFLMVLFGFNIATAQIFEPEGLNMPGAWDGTFRNPDAVDSAFQSSTQFSGSNGQITKITTGTTRWQTIFNVASSGANAVGGTRAFLFTSGSSSNYYANKWAGVTVTMDTEQSYTYNSGADNSITITNGMTYVVNWKDNGYAGTEAVFMELSATPIDIGSVSFSATDSDSITVSITLSGSKSAEEEIYVRYSDDSFSTSKHVMATGSGTSYSARVPASQDIDFYVFTSTVSLGSDFSTYADDYDLATIKLDNNSGSNYSYSYGYSVEISGDAGWRLLSLPKTGGTVADVSDDSPVQGITGGDNVSSDANFYIFNSGTSFTEPTNTSTAWGDGLGFAMYFFNNTTAGSSTLPITLDASGSEPSSDVSVSLNTTASSSSAGSGAANSKYTLVGNPFASNYNTNSITVTGDGIQNNIHFWNDGTSSYSAQDRTASSGYIIAPWQGFWVEVASEDNTSGITFPISGKTSTSATGTFFSKKAANRGDIAFTLSSESSYDEAIKIAVREDATLEFDRADATKLVPLVNEYATLAFKSNERLKSVESLPWNLEEEVKLDLEEQLVGVSGEFTLDWSGMETIPSDWTITFHDYKTGANIDMRLESKYVFETTGSSNQKVNPLSILKGPAAVEQKSKSAGTRFAITITPNTTSVNNEEEGKVEGFALSQNYPNPFNPTTTINYSVENAGLVTISIYNLMGQKVAELVNGTKAAGSYNVTWNAANAASGMYYYRLEAGGQTLTRKMTLIK